MLLSYLNFRGVKKWANFHYTNGGSDITQLSQALLILHVFIKARKESTLKWDFRLKAQNVPSITDVVA